ncbi:MAG: aminoglycoside phosphotransferase family protein [Chloroflexota bacterium]
MQHALAELRRHGVIGANGIECVPLRVYRDTAVVVLDRGAGPELVVKVDQPAMLWAVGRFHEAYRGLPLVSVLRHVNPAHRFLAYDWVPGELGRGLDPPPEKAEMLLALAQGLLCRYVPVDSADAGWLHELYGAEDGRPRGRTWQQFLGRGLAGRHDQVRAHLPRGASALVRRLAAAPHRRGEGPLHLLHGDCGAHNFVFQEGRLSAVIDPLPVAGEPVFELAFAFASWPGDLTLDAILPAAEALERAGRWRPPPRARRRVVIEEVVIALYSRVGTFVVNRPADVPAYLEAWAHWTDLLRRT